MESQNKSDHVMQKGLNIITWVMFVGCIAFSILFALIMILLLAAGIHHIWGVIKWSVRGVLLQSQR